MTDEEHHARAMLMGMDYDPFVRVYVTKGLGILQHNALVLDCDTLDGVSAMEMLSRIAERGPTGDRRW